MWNVFYIYFVILAVPTAQACKDDWIHEKNAEIAPTQALIVPVLVFLILGLVLFLPTKLSHVSGRPNLDLESNVRFFFA